MIVRRIISATKNKTPLLSLLFFTILGIAFQHHTIGFLVIPAMGGIWWIFQQWERKNFQRLIWRSSLVYFGLTWSWLLFIDPAGWSPLRGVVAKIFVAFVWVVVILIMSTPFYYMVKAWVKFQTLTKPSYLKSIFIFVSIWILQELARSYLFAFIMWGEGSSLSPHWNFGVLGLPLTSISGMLPLTSTFGMYGMSSLSILLGVLIYTVIARHKTKYTLLYLLAGIFFVGYMLNGLYKEPSNKTISVTLLNSSDAQIDYSRYPKPNNKSDLIVLPEYSNVFSDYQEEEIIQTQNEFLEKVATASSLILTSKDTQGENSATENKLVYYSPKGEIEHEQIKTFIIPGGEYLPYWFETFYKIISPSGLAEYNINRKIIPGPSPEKPINTEFGVIGSYACSGVISPMLYRNMARQGAQVLTNSASLTIFAGAETYHQQTEGFAVFHAAANQKPFVQSTKMGKAFIIDSSGKIQKRSDTAADVLLYAEIPLSNSITLYSRVGELTMYLALAYILWQHILVTKSKKQNLKNTRT